MMQSQYYVYILTNNYNRVLYTGVTNNILRRLQEHKSGRGSIFTSKYRAHKLVYLATFDKNLDASAFEKKLKAGSRQKKLDLINEMNPEWRDLITDY